MLRIQRSHRSIRLRGPSRSIGAICALAVLSSGCSAGLGRFDFPTASYNGDRTASLPTPSEPLRRNAGIPPSADPLPGDATPPAAYGAPDRAQPFASREPAVRMSGLPEPGSPASSLPPSSGRAVPPAASQRSAATTPANRMIPAATAPAAPVAAGQTIDVQPGDTLYAISKRHRVSISELMVVNNLQNPALKPGQKLSLPAGRRAVAARGPAGAPAQAVTAPVAAAPVVPVTAPLARTVPVAAPSDWGGSYTVAAGDSVYAIARKHNVKAADLQAANGITDPTKVRPGFVLKVPGATAAAPVVAAGPPAMPPVAAKPALGATAPVATGTPSSTRPTIINAGPAADPAGAKVAALGKAAGTQTDASVAPVALAAPSPVAEAAKAGPGTKFRWPAKGRVIASFGPRNDSTHNDGINISVPQGTDVVAAESGVVAYAGNELKGYGNLILVRHENNWVSAYAHNENLLVKRGDKVKRGQAIAKAGTTGSVDQPQVHFELRQGSKPVDPIPHMEKN